MTVVYIVSSVVIAFLLLGIIGHLFGIRRELMQIKELLKVHVMKGTAPKEEEEMTGFTVEKLTKEQQDELQRNTQ